MKRRSLVRALPSLAMLAGGGLLISGCGGGTSGEPEVTLPPAAPSPPAERTYAFVVNAESSDVSVFRIDANGNLNPVGRAPNLVGTVPSAGADYSIAVHPSGLLAYVAVDQAITAFRIDPDTGMLTYLANVAAVDHPSNLRIHPTGKFCYVVEWNTNSLLCFNIEEDTGALAPAAPIVLTTRLQNLCMEPTGNFIYVALGGGLVSCYAVDPGTGRLEHRSTTATAGGAHQIEATASGQTIFVATNSGLAIHNVDANGVIGAATLVSGSPAVSGLRTDPYRRFAYGFRQTIDGGDCQVSAFETSETVARYIGSTVVSGTQFADEGTALSPSGQFLYLTSVNLNQVRAFRIDQETLALEEFSLPFQTGQEPRSIAVVNFDH